MTEDSLIQRLKNYKNELIERRNLVLSFYTNRNEAPGREVDAYDLALNNLKRHAPELFEETQEQT